LDAERAREEFGVSVYSAREAEGARVDAFDVEADRAGREDPGLHDRERPRSVAEKGRRMGRFLQRATDSKVLIGPIRPKRSYFP